jgi:glycosyltransferase involved in cell wall biosynthesis
VPANLSLPYNQDFAVYGAGKAASAFLASFREGGDSVKMHCFIDSNRSGFFEDYPLLEFKEFKNKYGTDLPLVVASSYALEILLALDKSSYKKIFLYNFLDNKLVPVQEVGELLQRLKAKEFELIIEDSRFAKIVAPFIGLYLRYLHINKLESHSYLTKLIKLLLAKADFQTCKPHLLSLFCQVQSEKTTPKTPESPSVVRNKLLLYDTIFPSPIGTFAWEEYHNYLKAFPEANLYTLGSDFRNINNQKDFEQVFKNYSASHPDLAKRVFPFQGELPLAETKLFYTLFLRNIYAFIDLLEAYDIPFAFTLYSGGEFGLNNPKSDQMLQRVTQSHLFRKVIIGQKPIKEYLLEKSFVQEDQIEFIYSPIAQVEFVKENLKPKRFFPGEKNTFDICFIANRVMPKGENKGYDIFVETALILAKEEQHIRFHVFGNWSKDDIDTSEIKDKIIFHGTLPLSKLLEHYKDIDVVLSPSRPFVLASGDLDGAPNVANVEAGVAGVAVFITDDLDQCTEYRSGEELEIIPSDSRTISKRILHYFKNPQKLYELAKRGRRKMALVHGHDRQIKPRLSLLKNLLNE